MVHANEIFRCNMIIIIIVTPLRPDHVYISVRTPFADAGLYFMTESNDGARRAFDNRKLSVILRLTVPGTI